MEKQSLIMKLYPHKLFYNTVKCIISAYIYNFNIEAYDDFNYTGSLCNGTDSITSEKPLLVYEDGYASSTKDICLLFYRLRNKNKDLYEKCYLTWIEWSDSLEKNIQSLNRKSIIESLDKLELYLNENKGRSFLCNIDEDDKLSLADIFVYVSLKYCNIQICKESWMNINNYIERINKLEDIQKVINSASRKYKIKNIYNTYISKTQDKNLNEYLKKENFYVTTAINYVNGEPHIGHAYELVLADYIARYHRNLGRQTYLTCGADEHGIKMENAAKKNNLTPLELCNINILKFQKLNEILNISLDYYVRTTRDSHKEIVKKVWNICKEKGDIYLGEYEGWYNIREERYVSEEEAKLTNYVDPLSGIKLEKIKEPSYFLKIPKYKEKLINHINGNPDFIQPKEIRNEILEKLKEPLSDLSCSRTNLTWGIPVPNDSKHVMYVWMDALLNFYSNCFIDKEKEIFWPAGVVINGKDIAWFQSVIFPLILLSADIELPKCIFSHGHVLASDGTKMSKSLGNVINPFESIETYGSDAFRYHIIKETGKGCDMRFNVDILIKAYNSDIVDIIGTLVHRTLNLCEYANNSKIPPLFTNYNIDLPFNFLHFVNRVEYYVRDFCVQKCCEKTINACKHLYKYLTDLDPQKYEEMEKNKKLHIIRIMLESIYFIAHYLDIFIPCFTSHIFRKLNSPKKKVSDLSPWLNNLNEGTILNNGKDDILFKRI